MGKSPFNLTRLNHPRFEEVLHAAFSAIGQQLNDMHGLVKLTPDFGCFTDEALERGGMIIATTWGHDHTVVSALTHEVLHLSRANGESPYAAMHGFARQAAR